MAQIVSASVGRAVAGEIVIPEPVGPAYATWPDIFKHGLDVIGAFHSDTWGDFRTYFRFRLSPAGKIDRLDIGQAG